MHAAAVLTLAEKLIFTLVNFAQWLQPYNICKHSMQRHVCISSTPSRVFKARRWKPCVYVCQAFHRQNTQRYVFKEVGDPECFF